MYTHDQRKLGLILGCKPTVKTIYSDLEGESGNLGISRCTRAVEFSISLHSAIKKREKNLGGRLTYLPTRIVDRSIRLHVHVQLSTHALLKFTFLRWEFHVHDFVSRASPFCLSPSHPSRRLTLL